MDYDDDENDDWEGWGDQDEENDSEEQNMGNQDDYYWGNQDDYYGGNQDDYYGGSEEENMVDDDDSSEGKEETQFEPSYADGQRTGAGTTQIGGFVNYDNKEKFKPELLSIISELLPILSNNFELQQKLQDQKTKNFIIEQSENVSFINYKNPYCFLFGYMIVGLEDSFKNIIEYKNRLNKEDDILNKDIIKYIRLWKNLLNKLK